MKRWMGQALKRTAAAVLSAAMVFTLLLNAMPVWAADVEVDQQQGKLMLERYESQNGLTGDVFQDGDTIPMFETDTRSNMLLLYRGNNQNPMLASETTVQCISRANGQPIPEDVIRVVLYDNDGLIQQDFALYEIFINPGEAASDFWGTVSPEFGFDLVFQNRGETLTLHLTNEVQIQHPTHDLNVSRLDINQYTVQVSEFYISSGALKGCIPTLGWFGQDFSLSGDLAQYFTMGEIAGLKIDLNPTQALEQLENGTQVTGQLNWIGKLDGQTHSLNVNYYHSTLLDLHWYKKDTYSNSWLYETGAQLKGGNSGSILLTLRMSPEGEALPLTEDMIRADLPQGMTYTIQEDGCTLELNYQLTNEDAREQEYYLEALVPGTAWPARFTIQVQQAALHELGILSGSGYAYCSPWDNTIGLRTLMEDYIIVPLINGKPATTQQELEQCGLVVRDSEKADRLKTVARQVTYENKEGQTQEVWALCILSQQQETRQAEMDWETGELKYPYRMIVEKDGQELESIKYSISGCDEATVGRDTLLQMDAQYTYNPTNMSQSRGRLILQDETGAPLPLTEAPVVTGEAAGNIEVVWAEGVSGVRVRLTGENTPGKALVELRSGTTVRKILYKFNRFSERGTYYSLGTDEYNRPYNQSVYLTEALKDLSYGNTVRLNRMVEEGSFELYLAGNAYIAEEDKSSTGDIGSRFSFATELVKSVTYTTSNEEILRIEKEITHTDEKDPVFQGNGYSNPDGNCYGIELIPGGKTGECDVYATIELNIPSKNDPFGCDTSKTPTVVCVGYTFTITDSNTIQTIEAGPDTLQQILDELEISSESTLILLEGGQYPMDLDTKGKNVVIRSKDPQNPAVFTGDPQKTDGFIITATLTSADFVLQDVVVDGRGVRSGIQMVKGVNDESIKVQGTLKGCTILNCVTGETGFNYVRNTTFENCQLAAEKSKLYGCTFKNNQVAINYSENAQIKVVSASAKWCKFMDNQLDVRVLSTVLGAATMTLDVRQNYWNGASGPKAEIRDSSDEVIPSKKLVVYSSPYYTDENLTRLNIDLATTEIQDDILLLPVTDPSDQSASLVMGAETFETIKSLEKPVYFPVMDELTGNQIAQWEFETIQYTNIDTNLQVSDTLSDEAQAVVDQLPQEDQSKVVQKVNLSHNGQLPGRATLRIKASELPTGNVDDLKLYWVKPDGTIVPAEVIEVRYDPETQCYIITVDHCSEYIITSGSLTMVDESEPTATPVPSTPQPTATPVATAKPEGGKPTATPVATPKPEGGKPTATPVATPKPEGGKPTATPVATAKPEGGKPTATPVATAKPEGGKPTATPMATAKPEAGKPTATPVAGTTQPDTVQGTAQPNTGTTGSTASGNASQGATTGENQSSSNQTSGQSQLFSAQQVMDAFRQQAEESSVVIGVGQQAKVSQKAFELLKDRPDAQMRLEGEGYTWVFAGDTIAETTVPGGVFDTSISLTISEQAQKRIQEFAQGAAYQAVETAFSGQLPGPAQLEVTMREVAGKNCTMYWLPEEGEPVSIADVQVDGTGKAVLPLEHCSVYFLMVRSDSPVNSEVSSSAASDSGADSASQQVQAQPQKSLPVALIGTVAVVAVAAVAGYCIWRGKKD